jgi:hypothetical protein
MSSVPNHQVSSAHNGNSLAADLPENPSAMPVTPTYAQSSRSSAGPIYFDAHHSEEEDFMDRLTRERALENGKAFPFPLQNKLSLPRYTTFDIDSSDSDSDSEDYIPQSSHSLRTPRISKYRTSKSKRHNVSSSANNNLYPDVYASPTAQFQVKQAAVTAKTPHYVHVRGRSPSRKNTTNSCVEPSKFHLLLHNDSGYSSQHGSPSKPPIFGSSSEFSVNEFTPRMKPWRGHEKEWWFVQNGSERRGMKTFFSPVVSCQSHSLTMGQQNRVDLCPEITKLTFKNKFKDIGRSIRDCLRGKREGKLEKRDGGQVPEVKRSKERFLLE